MGTFDLQVRRTFRELHGRRARTGSQGVRVLLRAAHPGQRLLLGRDAAAGDAGAVRGGGAAGVERPLAVQTGNKNKPSEK